MPKLPTKKVATNTDVLIAIENSKGLKRELFIVCAAINAFEHVKDIEESTIKEGGETFKTLYALFDDKAFEIPEGLKKYGIKDSNEYLIAAVHHFWSEGRMQVKTVKVGDKTFKTKKTTAMKTTVFNKGKDNEKVVLQLFLMPVS